MTQSPIETRHKDMAAKAAGYTCWDEAMIDATGREQALLRDFAQTLANLEAARADLAEIDRILGPLTAAEMSDNAANRAANAHAIAAPYRASDPQPVTECPKCEAFRREVSDACKLVDGFLTMDRNSEWMVDSDAREALSRFIIPASDPVAEALAAALRATYSDDSSVGDAEALKKELASRGLEIVERRDR